MGKYNFYIYNEKGSRTVQADGWGISDSFLLKFYINENEIVAVFNMNNIYGFERGPLTNE